MHPHCSKFKLQFRCLLLVDPWLSFDPKCYAHVYVTAHYGVKKFEHFAELLQRLASREALGYFSGTLAVRVSGLMSHNPRLRHPLPACPLRFRIFD